MSKEAELSAKAAAAGAQITPEQFRNEFAARFPGVALTDGPRTCNDQDGNHYFTVVVGGLKDEGVEYPCFFYSIAGLWDTWWATLARFVHDQVAEVRIRTAPEVTWDLTHVLDTFYAADPRLVSRAEYQIFSRFSFVLKDQMGAKNG